MSCTAVPLYYKLKAVDIKPHCNAAQLTPSSLSAMDLLFENLTSVRVNTRAHVFSAKAQINSFQGSLFTHEPCRSFYKRCLSFIQSLIIMYSSCEKFCVCLSYTDKFTKLPCSLVDSCVGDGCDKASLMFFGRDIFGAHEMRRLVNSEFINFSSLTAMHLFRSQSNNKYT